ncbi:MAG: hypothetical protein QQN63_00140 [Nitrosopumilus sp.]
MGFAEGFARGLQGSLERREDRKEKEKEAARLEAARRNEFTFRLNANVESAKAQKKDVRTQIGIDSAQRFDLLNPVDEDTVDISVRSNKRNIFVNGSIAAGGSTQYEASLSADRARNQSKQNASDFTRVMALLTPEDQKRAARIKAGLDPQAAKVVANRTFNGKDGAVYIYNPNTDKFRIAEVDGVQLTAENTTANLVERAGQKEIVIQQAKLTVKTIGEGVKTLASINQNVLNIDQAISAIDDGADTGVIESFFPSITAASIKLDQIQGNLGLDVVGAVTFGALSAGELKLAMSVALPTNLQEGELRKWLVAKKEAQQKLSAYFGRQISFLNKGGTVVGFIEQEEATRDAATKDSDQKLAAIRPTGKDEQGNPWDFVNGVWVKRK